MGMRIANLPETSDVIAKTILWQYDRAPNLQQLLWHQRKEADGNTVQDGFLQLMLSSTHAVGKNFYKFIFDAVNTAEEEESLTEEEKAKLEFGLSLWTIIAGLQRPVVTDDDGTTRQVSLRAWARYIKGEIFKFYSNGSSESLNEFLGLTLKDTVAHVEDNQDMTQTYVFDTEPEGDDKDLTQVDDFLPHPGGVESVIRVLVESGYFGYNGFYTTGGSVLSTETENEGYYYPKTVSGTTVYPFVNAPYYDSTGEKLTYDIDGNYYYKLVKTNYGGPSAPTELFYSMDSEGVFHELSLIDATNYGYTDTTTGQVVKVAKQYFYTNLATGHQALSYVPAGGAVATEYWWYYAQSAAITTLYTKLADGTLQVLTKATVPYYYYTDATTGTRYYDPATQVCAWVTDPVTGLDVLKTLTLDVYTKTYYWSDDGGVTKHYVLGQDLYNYEHGYYFAGSNPGIREAKIYLGTQDSPVGGAATESSTLNLGDGTPDKTKPNSSGILYDSTEAK